LDTGVGTLETLIALEALRTIYTNVPVLTLRALRALNTGVGTLKTLVTLETNVALIPLVTLTALEALYPYITLETL
jgi:hypothetical protein